MDCVPARLRRAHNSSALGLTAVGPEGGPPASLKIEHCDYALTLDDERRILTDAAIVVSGNTITAVGKTADLKGETAEETIDARHFVVTPGFVSGHMHISYAHATRGIFPDDLGPAYLPNVFALQSVMTADEERLTSLLAITELLKYGTTTLVDPGSTRHIDACLDSYRQAGCRIVTGTQVSDRDNPLNVPTYETAEALEITRETIRRFDGALDGMVSAWAMPFSPDYCSAELLVGSAQIARDLDSRTTLHHSYTASSRSSWLDRTGRTPTAFLDQIGALDGRMLLAHALGITREDVRIIAESGASVAMCPTAAAKGGSGMTRTALLPELLDAGVPVGLGTDAANNSNLVETMRSMYLAAILYKDGREDVNMIPAETAVELATITGARALGMGDTIGSIEPGKRADLVLFDTRRAEWRTLFNPVNTLVYSADGRSVHTVIVDGRVVVRDHVPTYVDEWELIQEVQAFGPDMMKRAGVEFSSRWPVV